MAPPCSSCRYCGSTELERNEARGETICCRCGAVLEESAMVDSVQFMESASGGVTMCGQFVSSGGTGRMGGFAGMYGSKESRELVLQRGYNNLQKIADHLRLSNQCVEAAQRVYLMAVQRNFTVGRRNLYVASACLYAICRREKSPHMLIDFSDVLQTPVKTLGQVFMKMVRLLHLQVPHIDPSLFMERFASQMELGDKTLAVASTAVRLIQVMTRDWLSTGRRPTGLCGAALLIAARYHSIKMNADDIAHIVRISSLTVMKRLYEFKRTSTAALTAEEFEAADLNTLPILNGPPCLARRQQKMLTLQNGEEGERKRGGKGKALSKKLAAEAAKKAKAEEAKRKKRRGRRRQECTDSEETEEEEEVVVGEEDEDEIPAAPSALVGPLEDLATALSDGGAPLPSLRSAANIRMRNATQDEICNDNPSSDDIASLAEQMLSAINQNMTEGKDEVEEANTGEEEVGGNKLTGEAQNMKEVEVLPDDNNVMESNGEIRAEEEEEEEAGSEAGHPTPPQSICLGGGDAGGGADGLQEVLKMLGGAPEKADEEEGDEGNEDEEESLSDVETLGLDLLILNEKEKQAKALMWDEMTKDFMPEVCRRLKERMRKQKLADEAANPIKRKGTRRKEPVPFPEAATAADSVRMALQRSGRSIVNRLNDDVLASLFSGPVGSTTATTGYGGVAGQLDGDEDLDGDFFNLAGGAVS
eukprot:GHVS01072887.1.p1 GENE.GHVS01072887.1~~GHVS01072887.1.p1  ORF type:complete len:703 (-),score=169.90 GHVS01072887.1:188-2296(-)